jgi:hypothetical protein
LVSTFAVSHAENRVEFTMLVPLMNATFMRAVTGWARAGATRKPVAVRAAIIALALASSGCATRGPLHVYTLAAGGKRPVLDVGASTNAEVPSFLEDEDRVTGFAYDPYTDHFFLRLAPGNRIRVVDRPARAIKRELEIKGAPEGAGDLAIRPRDGYIYLLGPTLGRLLYCTRFGKYLGELTLENPASGATGLAFDMVKDVLLVLGDAGGRVTAHDLTGRKVAEVRLERRAGPALAFDSDQREYHAPLPDRPGEIAVFDENGRILRSTSAAAGSPLIDVGPRSFIRVF